MPNHTDNRVILSHEDPKQIDMIYNIMNTEDTPLCQTLIPMPQELEGTEGLSDGPNWYNWRLENWGTKWDIYDAHCDRIDANQLNISFLSAWSPPDRVFHKLVEMGFEIDARYFDEGWMYIGWFVHEDGQLLDYCESDINLAIATHPELDWEFSISYMQAEFDYEEQEANTGAIE
jgi:hypothetical protein